MESPSNIITLVSSILIRIGAYFFLRWIPTSIVPPAFLALVPAYVISFITSFQNTQPYKLVSDEIDIITRDVIGEDTASDEDQLLQEANDVALREVDVTETVVLEEEEPHVLRTLLTGLPSPTSAIWSWITFGINVALILMTLDHTLRAPYFYPSHDLSFARVGYVSDHDAKLLIREPSLSKLPIFAYYRYADTPLALETGHRAVDTSWKNVAKVDWLTDETDYTTTITIDGLKPDTKYQYSVNNVTGHFITAPSPGRVSRRNNGKYTFLHSSCIKPRVPYNPFDHPLHYPGFKHLAKWIPKLQAHFMLFLGDFIYADVPQRIGREVESYRKHYRQVYSSPDWPSVSDDLPWLHVLDDHEIANDWDANTTGLYQAAIDPWIHYQAEVNPPPQRKGQTYFSFTHGPAQFFLMDTRRYRSPEHEKPNDDPSKTMLGEPQLHDLLTWLKKPAPPGVRWKIVASSIPFTRNWRFGGEDTWGGYLAERREILEAMWDVGAKGGVGVIVLSGDRHEFAATAFPPPADGKWPASATVHEFSTSPLSMFYLPYRTYKEDPKENGSDVCLKYIPDGNSKFGAIDISVPEHGDQSLFTYRLFVDGEEVWTYTVTSPVPAESRVGGKAREGVWG